jgi:hypothetical protein
MSLKQIPKNAFSFVDPEASVQFAEDKVKIVGYSGKDIIGHWYWGKLAIDLDGMNAQRKIYPILEDHLTSRKIGFSLKPLIENHQLVHKDITYVDTPFADEFKKLSSTGFPYEASIYGRPSVIEEVKENESVPVNGRQFTGPGYIWRKWEYKETSVCVFGADSNTKAKAFSENDVEDVLMEDKLTEKPETKEVKRMTKDEFKNEFPEEFNKLMAEVKEGTKTEVETEVTKIVSTFQAKVETLTAEVGSLRDENLKLQKTEVIRREKEMQLEADKIWTDKLAESGIPDRLHGKIKKQVSYDKFVKDGNLDVESFTVAVDTELADWVELKTESKVDGFGASSKKEESTNEADDTWLKNMLKKAGDAKALETLQ